MMVVAGNPAIGQKSMDDVYSLALWTVGCFGGDSVTAQGHLQVEQTVVQIWKSRKDGYWLYAEEAVVDQMNAPHLQRIYRIYKDDSSLIREEYLIPQARRYAGAYGFKNPLRDLSIDQLSKRIGCEVYFQYDSGVFRGTTLRGTCPSIIGGVAYDMMESEIYPAMVSHWVRGYDKNDAMAWGVPSGPGILRKNKSFEVKKVRVEGERPLSVTPPVQEVDTLSKLPVPTPVQEVDTLSKLPVQASKATSKQLVGMLSGHFESKSETSDGLKYHDARLDILLMKKKKKGDYWLYAEEAVASQNAVSYRQQVFHIHMLGELFVQDIYTIRSPVRFEGSKKFESTLRKLRMDSLVLNTGCEIYFRYDSGRFAGQTNRLNCPSSVPGAASGLTTVTITGRELKFEELGFDAEGTPLPREFGPRIYRREDRNK